MEKLKLCHVSLAVYPDKRDGSAKYQRGIFEELKRRGHDITLLTAKWEDGIDDPNVISINVPNLRFLWLPKFALKYSRYLKKNDFDIIQGNGSRGSIPPLLSNKDYLTHIHDVGTFQASFTKIPGLRSLEIKNAQKAKLIMCCADSAGDEISKFMNVDRDKIFNVSSAVDSIYKPEREKAKKLKEHLNLNGPVLFYVGRIAFYKGVEDIIKAYKCAKEKIEDLELVIGGKPTIKMEEKVEKWKKDYSDVHFVGMIPDEEMPAYYTMADAFITYSFASEGFGLTPVEALNCGTPVICSSLPAYQEVIQDYGTFVKPKRPDLLAETIIDQISNPEIGLNKVNSAKEFLKRYTWKSVVDKVENVYSKYLEEFR